MTTFQVTFHYINNERKIEILEKSFLDIKNQLDLYEKQHLNTINSYLKNKQEELKSLNTRYITVEKEAQKRYDETLGAENPEDQNNISYAIHISGIDYLSENKIEETEEIGEKYSDFLDLFSKSTLIALYSLNENFLNKICDISSQTFNQKIKISHFNSRDYLKASFNYLELVIDIPKEPFKSYISKLKEIQLIRNKIIHAGSQITDDSILKIVKKHSDSFDYNERNQFVKIKSSKFVKDFFKLLKNVYEELLWLLEERQKNETLKNILENWFGLIEGKIIVTEIDSKKTSNKIRTIDFKIKSDNKNIPELNGKLTLTHSNEYNLEFIDQTENDLIKGFLEADKGGIYLKKGFKTFMSFNEKNDIRLLMY
ncbi:hypothetical protein Celal_3287 [Cellulophaga algicola DSM 14237]|uniref:Uncharacterized protein n=1 Tax=Cellulophaga algicola (strain DSM 14237 / IC166 / ACAM 630) TaxID=688270 RepID=E6X5J0_CELAD|nr:hypothetical protein [Cellulophaga algicola]ADV50545.1 hypothetical protein Celal_3279 [Cellulophaga algicola DSM 14237]ADV50553.1 hypothetical protein Celal_3287 [Cellulophaga algicola DSM 14237]